MNIKLKSLLESSLDGNREKKKVDKRVFTLWVKSTYGKGYKVEDIIGYDRAKMKFDKYGNTKKALSKSTGEETLQLRDETGNVIDDKSL